MNFKTIIRSKIVHTNSETKNAYNESRFLSVYWCILYLYHKHLLRVTCGKKKFSLQETFLLKIGNIRNMKIKPLIMYRFSDLSIRFWGIRHLIFKCFWRILKGTEANSRQCMEDKKNIVFKLWKTPNKVKKPELGYPLSLYIDFQIPVSTSNNHKNRNYFHVWSNIKSRNRNPNIRLDFFVRSIFRDSKTIWWAAINF